MRREVRTTLVNSSRSLYAFGKETLKASKNSSTISLAISYPSAMSRGCRPSEVKRSACFKSSPVKSTEEVVPSGGFIACYVKESMLCNSDRKMNRCHTRR